MKRLRERDLDPDQDVRDEAPQGPLWIEPLGQRSRRARYGLPVAVAAFLIGAFLLAMVSRYVTYFSGAGASPAPPTPIAWIDTTVAPTATVMVTPEPTYLPGEPTPTPRALISIQAEIILTSSYWRRGEDNHFTVVLTNRTGGPIPLDPCPTYRMYFVGFGRASASERVLNCALIGTELLPGQSVDLDMLYRPMFAPEAAGSLVWEWASPAGVQAVAFSKEPIYILG